MDSIDPIEQLKKLAEGYREELIANQFGPQLIFFTPNGVRLILTPQISETSTVRTLVGVCAVLGAAIADLDALIFITDSYRALGPKVDGTQWEPGEMEKIFNTDDPSAHLVTESLHYQYRLLGGEISITAVNYTRSATDVVFDWESVETRITSSTSGELIGNIADMLEAAFSNKKIFDSANQIFEATHHASSLTDEAKHAHALCAALKVVVGQIKTDFVVGADSDVESEIFTRSLSQLQGYREPRITTTDDLEEIQQLEELYQQPAVGESE